VWVLGHSSANTVVPALALLGHGGESGSRLDVLIQVDRLFDRTWP